VVSGIEEIKNQKGIYAYPNPATDILTIATEPHDIGSAISLYDGAGRVVYEGTIDNTFFKISTHSLPSGTYSLCIHSTDHITIYRGQVAICH
jgi:hypothetical protein